jgi:hypothetical protein
VGIVSKLLARFTRPRPQVPVSRRAYAALLRKRVEQARRRAMMGEPSRRWSANPIEDAETPRPSLLALMKGDDK